MSLYLEHILSADQFKRSDIEAVSKMAQNLEKLHFDPSAPLNTMLAGKTLACIFYEPSTRTSSSFIAAMGKLGGHVIPITQGVQFSSVSKGETLEDTITTLGQYADAIVLRHPETGAARRAALVSPVPVINAGDGVGEHPTQALLDLYTIRQEKKRCHGLHVVLSGDLYHGRTIHSLARLLGLYPNNTITFVSPDRLRAPYGLIRQLGEDGVTVYETEDFDSTLADADVLYMTRVQKERWEGQPVNAQAPNILTPERMAKLNEDAIILHPLPRVEEIPVAVDSDPRAIYFKQVRNGLFVRMALLKLVLSPSR